MPAVSLSQSVKTEFNSHNDVDDGKWQKVTVYPKHVAGYAAIGMATDAFYDMADRAEEPVRVKGRYATKVFLSSLGGTMERGARYGARAGNYVTAPVDFLLGHGRVEGDEYIDVKAVSRAGVAGHVIGLGTAAVSLGCQKFGGWVGRRIANADTSDRFVYYDNSLDAQKLDYTKRGEEAGKNTAKWVVGTFTGLGAGLIKIPGVVGKAGCTLAGGVGGFFCGLGYGAYQVYKLDDKAVVPR